MTAHTQVLVDTGILVALYDSGDRYHIQVVEFLNTYKGKLITTLACVTEVMWLLASDYRVQNEFYSIYQIEFMNVKSLNIQTF